MLRTKTNLKTDQEQFIRSDVPTARPLISVRPRRNLATRLNEHKRAAKKCDLNNNIAEHHLKTSYTMDWDSATSVIQYRLLSTTYTGKLVY